MQLTGLIPSSSNQQSLMVTTSKINDKKRVRAATEMPQIPTLESEPKKRRISIIIKTPLKLDAENGTTSLHTALQEGQYDQAVALIKKHSSLNVAENNTGWTPLHCLFCCSWDDEQFFNLLNLLLQGGCLPNAKSVNGETFLDKLAKGSHLSIDQYLNICQIISSKGYVFYDPESDVPPFLIDAAEAYQCVPIQTRIEIISNYFMFIPDDLKQQAAQNLFFKVLKSPEFHEGELAQLIEGLLSALKKYFDPAKAVNQDGDNLCFHALSNSYTEASEIAEIIYILHQYGVSTRECTSARSVFECVMAFQNSFRFKKELLLQLMKLGIKCTITQDEEADPLPENIAAIDYLLSLKIPGNEISEIMRIVTGTDWYREFLLLKLIANCFSKDIHWKVDGITIKLSGAKGTLRDFYRWLERDSLEFYESRGLSKESSANFLRSIASEVSTEAKKALYKLDETHWNELLNRAGGVLNRAFPQKQGYSSLTTLIDIQGLHVIMPSLRTDDLKVNHMIGLLFRRSEVLFCNKGDDLTSRSGISRHSLSDEKMNTIFQEALQGTHLYTFIRNHFLERVEEETGAPAPFIADQKEQLAGNCPVASYSSLEFGLLITLLEEVMPNTNKEIVTEIAHQIKKVHRLARRKKLLEEYQTFHSEGDAYPPSQLGSLWASLTTCTNKG